MSKARSDTSEAKKQDEIGKKVNTLLLESGNCAQTSFAILCDQNDIEGGQILKALTPFPGIALRGETCGAVIGSLMALGLLYGRDDMTDYRGFVRSLRPARKFCDQFEEKNGNTACREILKEKLGRSFDLSDRVEAVQYAQSGGAEACVEVVTNAVEIASKIIEKKKGGSKTR